jgi:hypothetical protein
MEKKKVASAEVFRKICKRAGKILSLGKLA